MELQAQMDPQFTQPLVAAITIFLLEERGEVLTPPSLRFPALRAGVWTSNSAGLKTKMAIFFSFCARRQRHTEQRNAEGYKLSFRNRKAGFSPQCCWYISRGTHPSPSPKDQLSLPERHRFQINEALTKVAVHQGTVRAKRDGTEGKEQLSWVILI